MTPKGEAKKWVFDLLDSDLACNMMDEVLGEFRNPRSFRAFAMHCGRELEKRLLDFQEQVKDAHR